MKCPACDMVGTKEIGNYGKYTLNLCNNCSVEFWTPLEHPGEVFYETSHLHDIEGERGLQWRHEMFLKNPGKRGRLLDIGCGPAEFLASCKELGFDVHGADIAPRNVEEAKRRYNIDIFQGTLSQFISANPDERFDIVTFFEIVEHLANPVEFFAEVKKILNPGGRIVMSVPNVDRFGGPKEKEEEPPNHLFRWRKPALQKFLEQHGYSEVEIITQPISSEFFLVRGWFSFGIAGKTDPRSSEYQGPPTTGSQSAKSQILRSAASLKNKLTRPISTVMALPLRLLGYKYWDMYATAKIK